MAARDDNAADECDMADIVRSRGRPYSRGLIPPFPEAANVLTVAVFGSGSVDTERDEDIDERRSFRALPMRVLMGGELGGGDSEIGVETEGVAVK